MKIGIIGGAGYIGSHVTQQLLAAGHHVRVSASQPAAAERYAHLPSLPGAIDRLELVPLDLLQPEQLSPFLAGCDAVIHTGTPFQLNVDNPERALIDPTVEGTRHLLAALSAHPNLRKLVFIASVAAHNTHYPFDVPGHEGPYTEQDPPYYSAEDHPYSRGKYRADQLVRNFLRTYTGECEIVTLSPVGVFGAALSDRQACTSVGMMHALRHRILDDPFVEMLFEQDASLAVVDVRDVATAAVRALELPRLHGRHFLLSVGSYPASDLHRLLNGQEPLAAPQQVYNAGASRRALGLEYHPATAFLRSESAAHSA